MDPAGAIGKLGFRRWYERQLIACHGWLVACLLCAFALGALLEDLNLHEFDLRAAGATLAAGAAGVIAWYALQRYLVMMVRAQRLAERSTCPQCGLFGSYRLIGATPTFMTVGCRRCAREWRID